MREQIDYPLLAESYPYDDPDCLLELICEVLCRIIFSYRYWLMLPTAEIAERLGFKESKVRTSLSRSRKKLRNHLIKEGLI